jgi:hypothetical protein
MATFCPSTRKPASPQSLAERGENSCNPRVGGRRDPEHADHRHRFLLRAGQVRIPCRAGENGHEIAAAHIQRSDMAQGWDNGSTETPRDSLGDTPEQRFGAATARVGFGALCEAHGADAEGLLRVVSCRTSRAH